MNNCHLLNLAFAERITFTVEDLVFVSLECNHVHRNVGEDILLHTIEIVNLS